MEDIELFDLFSFVYCFSKKLTFQCGLMTDDNSRGPLFDLPVDIYIFPKDNLNSLS